MRRTMTMTIKTTTTTHISQSVNGGSLLDNDNNDKNDNDDNDDDYVSTYIRMLLLFHQPVYL